MRNMKYVGKNVAGVWIDHEHASIISTGNRRNEGDYDVVQKVKAHHHGNHSGSEHGHNNKEAQELKHFYQDVAKLLEGDDAIYLIGPGIAQEQLQNFLLQNPHFKGKEIEIGTASHLTPNEIVAKVRTHFFH